MAIDAGTLWEFRAASGSATNGGGYSPDVSGAGTDYSNQDSAEETYTTLATSGAGVTTVTCSGGDTFDANIVGNVINIASGTNHQFRYVQVLTRTSSTEITVDRAPDDGVGGMASGVGSMGGAFDIITDAFFDSSTTNGVAPGNTLYIKNDGTMTIADAYFTMVFDGTNLLPITIEGYDATRGDNPAGANRPVIALGVRVFIVDDYYIFKNLIFTGTGTYVLRSDRFASIRNCKSTNSSGTANRSAIRFRGNCQDCEAICTNGKAFMVGDYGGGAHVGNCYAHDSSIGVDVNYRDGCSVVGTIFDTCSTSGVADNLGSDQSHIVGNTFYECTVGIKISVSAGGWVITDNIFDDPSGKGVEWTEGMVHLDYNIYNCTTDVTNCTKGPNAVTGDPLLTDPANGDFTLSSGSPAINAGAKLSTDLGTVGTYKRNIGVDQTDHSPVSTSTGRQWMLAGSGAISQDEGPVVLTTNIVVKHPRRGIF